jgi:amino acid adenylation domain-containing protein
MTEPSSRIAALSPKRRALLAQRLQAEAKAPPSSAIPRQRPGDGPRRLSFAQERLWFLDRWQPGSAAYNLLDAIRLTGRLRPGLLVSALREVLRRHEVLRTVFGESEGVPFQVVTPAPLEPLPVVDLSALPEPVRQPAARALAAAEGRTLFDLTSGPPLRARLLRLGDEEHLLVLSMHHIVADLWSFSVFTHELSSLYGMSLSGGLSPLPELEIQYADFAVWQRAWLSGEVLQEQLAFWRQQLTGAPLVLDLPTDRPRPSVQTFRGALLSFLLPGSSTVALKALLQAAGGTLFMVLLAAYEVLLFRYSGQEGMLLGAPVAGRTRRELEPLIGLFVNTLALRGDLSGDPSFLELLARVREMTLAALGHQDLPFERLVEELQPERDPSRPPLVQVMFAFQSAPVQEIELVSLTFAPLDLAADTAKFDLSLFVTERSGEVTAAFEYNTDLFDRPSIQRMAGHLLELLKGAAAEPLQRLSELSCLSLAERQQLLAEWSGAATGPSREVTIHGLFSEQAAQAPGAVALICGGERWTYADLEGRASRLAGRLRQIGVGAEVPVSVCARRSAELIVAMLAILKAGGAYVPIDPDYPRDRLRLLLSDARSPVLLVAESLLPALPQPLPASVRHVLHLETEVAAAVGTGLEVDGGTDPESLAYVMYTSGSTGVPKGVAVPHRAVVRLVRDTWYARFGPEEVFLQLAPVSFDASTLEIWGALLNGGRLVVGPPGAISLADLRSLLQTHRVTTLWLTAGLFHQMVEEELQGLSTVGQLLAGGDVLSPVHVRRVLSGLPGTVVINGYGPTENTTFTCCQPLSHPSQVALAVPIGRPIARTCVYLLDRSGQPVPVGIPGELYAGGNGLARGYWASPGLTAQSFVPDPFSTRPGQRLYRTGDLARWRPDGAIDFLGRIDQQVKIRGFRVEPGEIEAALSEHPAVRAAAVVVAGEGETRRLVAFCSPQEPEADAAELRRFLLQRLPEHLVPSAFVILPELPLTPNGKVDRRALVRLGVPEEDVREPGRAVPLDPVRELLAGIFSDLLGIAAGKIGAEDDFFERGGHSLLATRLVSRVREVFRIELPLRAVFESPTVAGLAAEIETVRRAGLESLPPIERTPRQGALPLSFAQQRLWFLDQLEPDSAAYNIPIALRLQGELDLGALAGALSEVVRRHETLRSTFARGPEGEPLQRVQPGSSVPLPVIDLRGLAAREAELTLLIREEAGRPFDLATGPVLRVTLVLSGEQEQVLLLSLHHIVSDGWSMGVLVREAGAAYRALAEGRAPSLPPLPIQYGDFVLWQRSWLQRERLEPQLAWWREHLAGAPAVLDLPADRPRPTVRSSRGGQVPVRVGPAVASRLAAFGRSQGATPFMLYLAAYQSLLGRLAGREDLVVGLPIGGRVRAELEDLLGLFLNTLALRGDLSENPTFIEHLGRVREAALGAFAHQDLPFELLVEELAPERNLTHAPVFQVLFVFQNAPLGSMELPGLVWIPLETGAGAAKFDLTLTLWEQDDGLTGYLDFHRDLFDEATVRRWSRHLGVLLEGMVREPERRLAERELLNVAERHQILLGWNDTAIGAVNETVHGLFAVQARRSPGAVALRFQGEEMSFGELDRRSNRVARLLRSLGVGPDVLVGLCMERSLELMVGLLGILKAGGGYVPLDPGYPPERLAYMLEDSAAPVLLSQERLAGLLPVGEARRVLLDADWERIVAHSDEALDVAVDIDNLLCVLYTSGSTGRPKGVMDSHRCVVNQILWLQATFRLDRTERLLQKTPISWDVSLWELFWPLMSGACLVLAIPGGHQDPAYMAETIEREGITMVHFVPSMLRIFLETADLERCRSLRRVVSSGEALGLDLEEKFFAASTVELNSTYGPGELARTTLWRCERGNTRAIAPLGRPTHDTQVYVLDRELQPVPIGVTGELYVAGQSMARGYHRRPDLTAEKFLANPFSAGERLYRTGDLGRTLPDGTLEFLGRIDHQVKVRGVRIELGEIELALSQLPGVKDAVVMARSAGTGEKRLAAYVVPEGGLESARIDELREHLRSTLPDYMVPESWAVLPALPLAPNGKADRERLPEPQWVSWRRDYVAPRTPVEDLLATVWAELLGLEKVGVQDGFFDLGGNSLLATQVASRVRSVFGVEMPLRTVFERPTLAELAAVVTELLRRDRDSVAPPLLPVPRTGPLPLSFAQQRLWFLHQLDPASPAYNIPSALWMSGALAPEVLARTLSEIVRRHENLRTTFEARGGKPAQVIHPAAPAPLPMVDLAALPSEARDRLARRLAEEEAGRPFDLTAGPLLRVSLLRLDAQEHALLTTLHHVVSDGWSSGVLVREASVLYQAFREGGPSPLPELPVQYADFAHWQRQWLSGEVLEEQLGYWRRQLAGLPDGLDLPLDRERPVLPSLQGGLRLRAFSDELQTALNRLGRSRGTTFFMTMLAVFSALLQRLSRQEDVVMGTSIANRNRMETEGLIGFFVNTLVLRIDGSGGPSFDQLLARAREVALGASTHQDLPFERLVEELAPERNLGRTPLFQVMFVVQNAPSESLHLQGLSWTPMFTETKTANFDLTLRLFETRRGLEASLEYKKALFDASTIDRLLGHFETLASSAVAMPGAPVSRLPVLTGSERNQLSCEPLAAVRLFPAGISLHRLFERQAVRHPDAVAVVCGGERLTYAELDARAGHLAARLRRLGVGPEVRVALWLDRSLELVTAVLGVLKAGGAYVPLDPSYPEGRLRFILEDAGVAVLVSVRELLERLGPQSVETVLLDELEEVSADPGLYLDLPDSTAYVIYTSGSTGTPKGVPVSHANAVRLFSATQEWFGFDDRDVWTLFHSYAFDFSVWELWGALLYGGRLVVVPYWVSRSPEAFYDLLAEEGVTVLNQTPSAFHQLAAVEEEPGRRSELALRWVIFGGEALEPRRLRSWFTRHGDRQPALVNMYGITETTVHVTFRALSEADLEHGSVIGAPIPDLYLQLLDPEGEPVPLGVPGEIHVGGAGLARGYLGRPELTAQRFVPDPFGPWPGARLYASGDLARRRPDGELEYLGRTDQQVKIRGFRIELGEIEAALARHPAVREVVVLARDGQGEKRLVAYLGVGAGEAPGIEELRAFLRERLPEHMMPAVFMSLETLPLTAHGKVDRRALPEPDLARPELEAVYTAPRTPEEAILAEVWADVLEVDRVGVHDNFFALGGDSILSIRVRSLAAERGLHFELQDLFLYQTIEALAQGARRTAGDLEALAPFSLVSPEDQERLPDGLEDAYPLSMLQLGMLFHSESGEGSIPYHNVSSFTLRGSLDVAALTRALARLAARHAVLRTSFDEVQFSEPLQLVHRETRIPLDFADLRVLSPAERKRVIGERFEAERSRRFDWSRAPLLRFWVHRLTDDTCELGVTEHHAIVDGWSFASLLAELFALYFEEIDGKPRALPPLTNVSFRDFIALERRTLASEESHRYWMERLAGHTFRELPRWPARPPVPRQRIHSVAIPLTAEAVEALGRLADTLGVPFKSVLLASHIRVLELLGGDPDVTTGLVVNGRPEVEGGERVLGLFLNTVPLRLRLTEGTWRDLVRAVFEAERDLLPYRRFSLAELQRRVGNGRPLFEVNFNYVHFHVLQSTRDLEVLDVQTFAETSFALTVHCHRSALSSDLQMLLQYDARELHSAQVRMFSELYAHTLLAMARDPDAAWAFPLPLPEAQIHQVLREWSQTGSRPVSGLCAHQLFQAAARRSPDSAALLFKGEPLTYAELDRRSDLLAHALRRTGAEPGARIGLCFERSPEMVEALLAVLKVGAAYVPLEPGHPSERLAYILADSEISLLLTRERHLSHLSAGQAALPRTLLLDADREITAGLPDTRPSRPVDLDDLAYILYTSGSTGRPKGVMVSHRGLVNYLLWAVEAYQVMEGTGAPVHSALGFDLTVTSLLLPLVAGRTVTLLPEGGDVEALAGMLRQAAGLSLVKITPAHLEGLCHLLPAEECAGRARTLVIGGEALTFENLDFWRRNAPETRLINEYGPTETVVGCCVHSLAPDDSGPGAVPIGRAIANTWLYVVGPGFLPAPPGVSGELWIGGEGVARGYLNRPDLTAERFVPDPFGAEPGRRLYRTGDRVRHLPDGRLEFLGRIDYQIKIRGFRIEPSEIEAALRAHPRVMDAVVVAREGAAGDRRLVAYLGAEPEPPSVDELREFLKGRLPEYMLPSTFVLLPQIPLTSNGKIDRSALPEPGQAARLERVAVPPRDEVELRLTQIWEDLLEMRPVGIRDDFFALGGHSLLALRLMGTIERLFGRRIPLSALLEASTVERLAHLLRLDTDVPQRSLRVPLQPRGSGGPLFCIHPVGGNVFCYLPMAREGGLSVPVVGIQAPGSGELPDPWTVEAMAELYLATIRETQPAGPYLLMGWSMGGVVAFEIARQLEAAGDKVLLLAMLDVAPPGPGISVEADPEHELVQFVLDLVALAGFEAPVLLPAVPATLDALLEREELRAALPPGFEADQVRELFALFRANRRALRVYRPGPYGGQVTLIRADETAASSDGLQAWSELAGRGSEVYILPGDHYSLLRSPRVSALGALIEDCLKRALAGFQR